VSVLFDDAGYRTLDVELVLEAGLLTPAEGRPRSVSGSSRPRR
jgi:hypothetical protein